MWICYTLWNCYDIVWLADSGYLVADLEIAYKRNRGMKKENEKGMKRGEEQNEKDSAD